MFLVYFHISTLLFLSWAVKVQGGGHSGLPACAGKGVLPAGWALGSVCSLVLVGASVCLCSMCACSVHTHVCGHASAAGTWSPAPESCLGSWRAADRSSLCQAPSVLKHTAHLLLEPPRPPCTRWGPECGRSLRKATPVLPWRKGLGQRFLPASIQGSGPHLPHDLA